MATRSDLRSSVFTMEDFLRDAEPCSLFKDVQKQINDELPLIDESNLRRDRAWSLLGSQVVGAEVFPKEVKT